MAMEAGNMDAGKTETCRIMHDEIQKRDNGVNTDNTVALQQDLW
jgi:hypothetical protein